MCCNYRRVRWILASISGYETTIQPWRKNYVSFESEPSYCNPKVNLEHLMNLKNGSSRDAIVISKSGATSFFFYTQGSVLQDQFSAGIERRRDVSPESLFHARTSEEIASMEMRHCSLIEDGTGKEGACLSRIARSLVPGNWWVATGDPELRMANKMDKSPTWRPYGRHHLPGVQHLPTPSAKLCDAVRWVRRSATHRSTNARRWVIHEEWKRHRFQQQQQQQQHGSF